MNKRALILAAVLVSPPSSADYVYAQYGSAQLDYRHDYVENSRLSAQVSAVGIGAKLSDNTALELAFHDFGTYRFVGAKPLSKTFEWHLGPFTFPYTLRLDLPAYVEARAYGTGLGVRYKPGPLTFKLEAVYATAEAELHTPLGYAMLTRKGWLPRAEAGVRTGRLFLTYAIMPRIRSYSIGVAMELK